MDRFDWKNNGKYLNPQVILDNGQSYSFTLNKVYGFFNGLYWVMPNPAKSDLLKMIDAQYEMGYFFEKQVFYISDNILSQITSWNDTC